MASRMQYSMVPMMLFVIASYVLGGGPSISSSENTLDERAPVNDLRDKLLQRRARRNGRRNRSWPFKEASTWLWAWQKAWVSIWQPRCQRSANWSTSSKSKEGQNRVAVAAGRQLDQEEAGEACSVESVLLLR